MKPVTHAQPPIPHGERQRGSAAFAFLCLHITQRAQHVPLPALLPINIPAAGFKPKADIRLEITPRIEEGRLIFLSLYRTVLPLLLRRRGLLFINFSETGDANKAEKSVCQVSSVKRWLNHYNHGPDNILPADGRHTRPVGVQLRIPSV